MPSLVMLRTQPACRRAGFFTPWLCMRLAALPARSSRLRLCTLSTPSRCGPTPLLPVACCIPGATACGATAQSSPQCAALLSSSGAAFGASSGCELGGVRQHRCPCIVPPARTDRMPLRCVGEVSGAGPEDVGAPARAAGRGLSALRLPRPVRRAGHRGGGFGSHRRLLPSQARARDSSHHGCWARDSTHHGCLARDSTHHGCLARSPMCIMCRLGVTIW